MGKALDDARRHATFVGGIILTYTLVVFIFLGMLLILTFWLNTIYLAAYDSQLDLGTPLQNFTVTKLPIKLPSFSPFQFKSDGSVDVERLRQFVVGSYLAELTLILIAGPQFAGALCLLRATQRDIDLADAERLAFFHQIVQSVIGIMEAVMLTLGNICYIFWPTAGSSLFTVITVIVFVVVAFRHFMLRIVDRFVGEIQKMQNSNLYKILSAATNSKSKLKNRSENKTELTKELDNDSAIEVDIFANN